MKDGTVNGLFELAMRRIKEASAEKQAFVGQPDIQAGLQPPQDPAMAAQGGQPPMDPAMAAQGQPMPQDPAAAAQGQPMPAEPMQAAQGGAQPPAAGGVPPEVRDVVIDAVRQVLQEMGVPGQPAQTEAQPAPEVAPAQAKGKGKGGKIDPEDFAKLQAVVAMLLEHLGLADMSGALQEAATPSEQPAAQGVQEEKGAQDTQGMGAHPGTAAELPVDAQPLGPLDPNAGQHMADAGANGRRLAGRVGKRAARIRGERG